MPIFKKGQMLNAPGIKIVTANSFIITRQEKLLMERGTALELRQMVPNIEFVFGKMIIETCGHLGVYGLLMNGKYGAAQIKYDFRDNADLGLIAVSMGILADKAKANGHTYNINYPGIGHGGLSKAEVNPLLEILPDNVHVWEREKLR
jgi:hypothetical protein